jgi:hypothetical protein
VAYIGFDATGVRKVPWGFSMELNPKPIRLTPCKAKKRNAFKEKRMRKVLALIAMVVGMVVAVPNQASAITYGDLVTDPVATAPYVVSIWSSPTIDGDKKYICTGTLVDPRVVVTAANCLTEKVFYFAKVGANTLEDETEFVAATNWMALPRFTTKSPISDIAVMHLAGTYTGSIIPGIASEEDASAIARTRPYMMYGWGIDQNKQSADLLRSATLTPQDSVAGRFYGKYFNKTLMMAAGRGIPVEKVYAGGCVGDAGAPLVATVNGVTKLIGITSWFAKDCRVAAPTVFARVSYYAKDIAKAVIDVKAAAKSVKITKSVVKVDAPVMNGQLFINGLYPNNRLYHGQMLTADGWWWGSSIEAESIRWYVTTMPNAPMNRVGRLVGTGPSIYLTWSLLQQNAGSYLVAEVSGSVGNQVTTNVAAVYLNPYLIG